MFNSPGNPTGAVAGEAETRGLAELAAERNVVLISDEIYRAFCYDAPFVSPASYNPQTLVVDGFSKTYGMPGWRLGFAHGPSADHPRDDQAAAVQFRLCAAAGAMGRRRGDGRRHEPQIAAYRRKARPARGRAWPTTTKWSGPAGRFTSFPRPPGAPAPSSSTAAIERQLLIIPGNVFSRRDTHFRISYAASDATLDRGIEVLRGLARGQSPDKT